MLPPGLLSSYMSYKDDTKIVATWLANNAKRCGYSADLLDRITDPGSSVASQPSTRLKGKARVQARATAYVKPPDATTSTSNGNAHKVSPAFIIEVKDFIKLAECIVNCSKPLIKVPRAMVKALDRAITLRKGVGLSSRGSDESDDGHAHFVGVLERTKEVLKPRLPSDVTNDRLTQFSAHPQTNNPAMSENIKNMFDKLDLQEPSRDSIDGSNAESPVAADKDQKPTYDVEHEKNVVEEHFAVHCLFKDITNIRNWIIELWAYKYHNGDNLVAVSITIDTAIGFVRTLEEDLTKQFPSKSDYPHIVDYYYNVSCRLRGQNVNARERPEDPFNFAVHDLLDVLMLPTFTVLNSMEDLMRSGLDLNSPGKRDKSTPWIHKSPRDQVEDDCVVLLAALPHLHVWLANFSDRPLGADEFSRGIKQMAPGKPIPLWLVFAAQCFLDAQHQLGDQVEYGYNSLLRNAWLIKKSIEETLDFHKALRSPNWRKQNEKPLTDMLYNIDEFVINDAIARCWNNVVSPATISRFTG